MQAISNAEAAVTESVRAEGTGRRRDYIGSGGKIAPGPQAFLVERLYANARIDPHFHDVDQFQVVVQGNGRIGKTAVEPVTFQYADAYTPYGPIVAKEAGIAFFTLRPVASGGHFSMPGNRHRMPCRAGRNLSGMVAANLAPVAAGNVARETLLPAEADGVMAVCLRLGAHASTAGVPSDAGGQYYLVSGGTLIQPGRDLGRHALIHVAAGETAPTLTAGAEGATLLMMQFGRPSDRPGSNVSMLAARDPSSYVERHR
ncbi:MAG: hypothetical protein EXQ87_12925 [Alphaproteobacteria bacterium]|nr:hypothetical protein [Alphaproteobacteria bacterium]